MRELRYDKNKLFCADSGLIFCLFSAAAAAAAATMTSLLLFIKKEGQCPGCALYFHSVITTK